MIGGIQMGNETENDLPITVKGKKSKRKVRGAKFTALEHRLIGVALVLYKGQQEEAWRDANSVAIKEIPEDVFAIDELRKLCNEFEV